MSDKDAKVMGIGIARQWDLPGPSDKVYFMEIVHAYTEIVSMPIAAKVHRMKRGARIRATRDR